MIYVYITRYFLENNEKKYKKEHYLGRYLLKKGLKDIYNIDIDIEELERNIKKSRQGKPYLDKYNFIKFNISHTKSLVLCAFSDADIGIDVEKISDFRESIIKKVLSSREEDILESYVDDKLNYNRVFYKFWTLKESYLKYRGSGLVKDLFNIEFYNDDFLNIENISCKDGTVSLQSKIIEKEYILSICYSKREEKIIYKMV